MKTIQFNATVSRDGHLTATVPIDKIPSGTHSIRLDIHEQPSSNEPPDLESEPAVIRGEITPTFANLLTRFMRRIRASDHDVAVEIGCSDQTVNRWRHGEAMPGRRSCPNVQDAAKFLRLTKQETYLFLTAAGCSEADMYLDLPEAIFRGHINSLFVKLVELSIRNNPPVMLLLSQAGWDQPPSRKALLVQAENKYGSENVLHIQPPPADDLTEEGVDNCFSYMGAQLEFENVTNALSFSQAVKARLEQTDKLFFVLVSRFEQGAPLLRQQLAKLLRALIDTYQPRLHMLLCGGETLEELKYRNGKLSLLNIAKDERWPEIGRNEVSALLRHERLKKLELDEALVDKLLTISGGHPGLLNECLTLRQQQPNLPLSDYPEKLSQSEHARQPFEELIQHDDEGMQQSVRQRLSKDGDLGKFSTDIRFEDLRWLYWKNLLVVREIDGKRRLFWRCEALRMAGQNRLG